MALRNARDLYTRRQEGVSIWVVPAADITASSPDEKDAFFDPAADKIYRHPTFYEVPEGRSTCERRGCDYALRARRRRADRRAAARPSGRARAPEMEEDVALANIALDQLGAARLLLTYAGELEGPGATRTTLAYLRDDREFRNCLLVELRRTATSTGSTIAKLLLPRRRTSCRSTSGWPLGRRAAGRDRRQGGQGVGVPPRPRGTVDGAAGRRHRRVAPADAGRGGRAVAVHP